MFFVVNFCKIAAYLQVDKRLCGVICLYRSEVLALLPPEKIPSFG